MSFFEKKISMFYLLYKFVLNFAQTGDEADLPSLDCHSIDVSVVWLSCLIEGSFCLHLKSFPGHHPENQFTTLSIVLLIRKHHHATVRHWKGVVSLPSHMVQTRSQGLYLESGKEKGKRKKEMEKKQMGKGKPQDGRSGCCNSRNLNL